MATPPAGIRVRGRAVARLGITSPASPAAAFSTRPEILSAHARTPAEGQEAGSESGQLPAAKSRRAGNRRTIRMPRWRPFVLDVRIRRANLVQGHVIGRHKHDRCTNPDYVREPAESMSR